MFAGEGFEKDLKELHLDLSTQQTIKHLRTRWLIEVIKRLRGFSVGAGMRAQRQQAQRGDDLLHGGAKAIVHHQDLTIALVFVRLEELYGQIPRLLISDLTHKQLDVGRAQANTTI